ncbi:chemotaxis protein CheD [Rhizobium puerariae]|uniref:Probable chemoreceptor glutamine deamidase CheD n=1 Tax=Rhizobium puerariae TaxID=1585791 RepID=A0ABV6AQH9_9HYPH
MNLQSIHILGGQSTVSTDPNTVLVTILGSCVSACIYDPVASVGGMNHFILPTGGLLETADREMRYGDVALRVLVDDLCRCGAERRRLEAKLYGGRMRAFGGPRIGARNAAFAKRFLLSEGIRLVEESLGDDLARWVTFHPTTGRTWMRATADVEAPVSAATPTRWAS